jgi:sporulation protein YlmC with PRC-barrel domain
MEGIKIALGAPVRCGSAQVGKVADVLVDPVDRHLTHIVVKTRDKQVRRVPVELVDLVHDRPDVALTCTQEELAALEPIRHFAYLEFGEPATTEPGSDVGVEEVVSLPCFEATEFGDYVGDFDAGVALTYDEIPKGEAELRRTSAMLSADGHALGHVDGLILGDRGITHVVLAHGHLWRLRRVAIPIDAVDAIETDVVTVRLSKDDVDTLPRERRA